MADCDLPAMQPLLAVFDAAISGSLDAADIASITAEVAAPPALPGVIQAVMIIEVIEAIADLPPMPALGPLPAAGFTTNLDWNPAVQGLALATTVVAMIGIPLDLIVGTLLGNPPAFPDIVTESLPDIPGAATLAECIEEKLPMFG